jgi:lipoprotein-anchoring transpeptidase ErfK/SrfK
MSRFTKVCVGLAIIGVLGAGNAKAAVPSAQETVKLLADTTAHAYPGDSAREINKISATTPLTSAPMTLPVIGHASADGQPWLRVRLPNRPNSSTGWIPAAGTQLDQAKWRVIVDRSARHARIFSSGHLTRQVSVVVGKPATPTPTGEFFIVERVPQPHGSVIGPWALATNAYSNVLQEFDGGPGQLALHGRTGLPDPLGSAASHGCIRFTDPLIRWLAAHAPAGTPVTITR